MINGTHVLAGTSLLLGLRLVSIWVVPFHRAIVSRSWHVAKGRVITSGLDGVPEVNPHTRRTAFITPKVRYSYQVAGTTYYSTRINFTGHGDRSSTRAMLRYPPGKRVLVWYNPTKPEDAVLEPGVTIAAVVLGGLAVLWVVASAGVLISAL